MEIMTGEKQTVSGMCDNKEILISVIMPVYNSEKYLKSSVESVLRQSFEDFELIIIDDGSTDSSYAIISDLARIDSRIRMIRQENQGASAARNHGLEAAAGEFVSFIDSDDRYDADYLEKLYLCADESGADVVVCGYSDSDDNEIGAGMEKEYDGSEEIKKDIYSMLERGYINSPCNKLYRRKVINVSFPAGISIGEDLIFNLRVFRDCKKIKLIPSVLYRYNTSSGGLHVKYNENEFEDRFFILKELDAFLGDENDKSKAATVSLSTYLTCIQHLILTDGIPSAEKRKIYDRWRKSPEIINLHSNYHLINRKLKILFKHERFWLWKLYIAVSHC